MRQFRCGMRSVSTVLAGFAAVVGLLAGCGSPQVRLPPATATAAVVAPPAVSTPAAGGPAAQTAAMPTAGLETPTGIPTPVASATPALSSPAATVVPPSPTAVTTALVTSTSPSTAAVLPNCATLPIRGFGLVWQDHPDVQGLVGCPTAAEAATGVVSEPFQHGWMIQLSSSAHGEGRGRVVYVLFDDDATVAQVPDTWTAADTVPAGPTPPAGLVAPVRDFGKVWRDGTDMRIRERLGWANGPEKGASGAWQPYQRGQMIWTPDPKQIFVLGTVGQATGVPDAWHLYPDLFAG